MTDQTIYKVSGWDSEEKYFTDKKKAKKYKNKKKKELHRSVCINKREKMNTHCLCDINCGQENAGGYVECAHHHYMKTVDFLPHDTILCPIANEVCIEKIIVE
jgi:hypothetical protein